MSFKEIDPKITLPQVEEQILKFWQENKIFEKSVENRKDSKNYSFYDGPPFATGSPHYGHIVASTMKDVVPRYWTMRGFAVERRWGWDCHGLPIENLAEKELGITHKKEIEEMGVEKFNNVCRSKILEYVGEWEKVIPRLGRWAEMKNAYKTMDLPYMESVWWTFKELWDRGLIYEGYRAMHICPRCETTLSQSEVAEGYKTIKDLSLVVKFELANEPQTFVLAWTTTPWTLIGNAALAVGAEINYVKVQLKSQNENLKINEYYILAKDRLADIIKDDYQIIAEFKGQELVGKKYKPLFDYYAKDEQLENRGRGWQIYSADFVSTAEGTGVVHIAPAFGEDDMNLGQAQNLPFIQHISMSGIVAPKAIDFAGMSVKPADDVQKTDRIIVRNLEGRGLLFWQNQYEHAYPHCWRCETPLLNYATSSYFVKVSAIKSKALSLAKEIHWSSTHIKEGRFGKWLEGGRDWSISRQRYWASVIPIWRCDKGDHLVVFGSVADLEKASAQKVKDLHKDTVDKIVFACPKCPGQMHRLPDVLDTWFDSGSMPYAQTHYPFENREKFSQSFPADFIAEGVDQTRAWFYYLHLIAAAIKESIAFKNVIVNGIVLAEDGKKMSKRLQNYPDPMAMFDKYGADAVRFYLLSSPVVAAENLNFTEKDVAEISRGSFRMLWNVYSFFVMYANIGRWEPSKSQISNLKPQNVLDCWIISELNLMIKNINAAMEKYELMKAARYFPPFIDDLSNWYLRRCRRRFKSANEEDKNQAFQTLYFILAELSKLAAPFTPFITEEIFKNLTGEESVHLADYPAADEAKINIELNAQMQQARQLVEAGLSQRAAAKIRVRQPLSCATVKTNLPAEILEIIKDEINVKAIKIDAQIADEISLDTNLTAELQVEGTKNDIIRAVQDLRKKAGFTPANKVALFYRTTDENLAGILEKFDIMIIKETNLSQIERSENAKTDADTTIGTLWLGVKK